MHRTAFCWVNETALYFIHNIAMSSRFRKKAREVGKAEEPPASPMPPPPKLSVHAERLRVIPLRLSPPSTRSRSGSKANSVPGRRKVTKSTYALGEEEHLRIGDQPAQLAQTETQTEAQTEAQTETQTEAQTEAQTRTQAATQVQTKAPTPEEHTEKQACDPVAPKPPLAAKQNKRKKARKVARAYKRPGANVFVKTPAARKKDEKAHTSSQVPPALASQSGAGTTGAVQYQGMQVHTTSGSEIRPVDGKPTAVTHLRSVKEQGVKSTIHEEPQQDKPSNSPASKQQRLSDDSPAKSAKSRRKLQIIDVEAGEPVLESDRGEKAATQKQLSVVTVVATEKFESSLPTTGSRKTTPRRAVGQQHSSKDGRVAGDFEAKRRVTVPLNIEGVSPLHLPVFELSRLTRASKALSSQQSPQLMTTLANVEDTSSPPALILESTRISQVCAGRSPCDQAEKKERNSKSFHHRKRPWPAPWDELLVLGTACEREKESSHSIRPPSLDRQKGLSTGPAGPEGSDDSVAEGGNKVDDSVTPWYENMFGKCGAPGEESGEGDDIESLHWKLDYEEPSCHSSDSSLSLPSLESDDDVVTAFENDCKFRKLARQTDQSSQSHEDAKRLERQRKDTRRRVQQFLPGITLTKGAYEAFEECEERFMEHMQKSVEELALHAGRKKVEAQDYITFIQRYLGTSDPTKLMALAEELLPADQRRRLFPPTPNALLTGKAEKPL